MSDTHTHTYVHTLTHFQYTPLILGVLFLFGVARLLDWVTL